MSLALVQSIRLLLSKNAEHIQQHALHNKEQLTLFEQLSQLRVKIDACTMH